VYFLAYFSELQIDSSNRPGSYYLYTLYFYGRNFGYLNAAACDQNRIPGSWQCSPNGIDCRTGVPVLYRIAAD
jgi:hypothetical protein